MAYTVMVVDDSSIIRAAIGRALGITKLPIEAVLEAPNGIEALAQMRNHWVDIVFTDINMPEMGGVELIDRMKRDPEFADIPVVIISTEGSKKRIAELVEKGANGYLRKPFTPEKLRDVILETLGAWHESTGR